jgi:hypothetical protein
MNEESSVAWGPGDPIQISNIEILLGRLLRLETIYSNNYLDL